MQKHILTNLKKQTRKQKTQLSCLPTFGNKSLQLVSFLTEYQTSIKPHSVTQSEQVTALHHSKKAGKKYH